MFFFRKTKRLPQDGLDRILIRGTNWLGDVIMSLPAVLAIRKAYPKATLAVLARPWVADLYRFCPVVDEVILYHRPGEHEGMGGILRLARQLRERKFNLAVLLQNALEAAVIARLADIPLRAGYNTDGRALLLTHGIPRKKEINRRHQSLYYLHLVSELGCPAAGAGPLLAVDERHRLGAAELIATGSLLGRGPRVGMAVGAAYGPAKIWFPDRFAALADRLIEDAGAQVIILGAASDRRQAAAVAGLMKHRPQDLTGRTSLAEAIALIERLNLMIANDSGLMHIAGALGVPTVAIFGSTDPQATSPLGRQTTVIHKPQDCSPCLKKTCPTDYRCLDAIGVEEVYRAAATYLNARQISAPC